MSCIHIIHNIQMWPHSCAHVTRRTRVHPYYPLKTHLTILKGPFVNNKTATFFFILRFADHGSRITEGRIGQQRGTCETNEKKQQQQKHVELLLEQKQHHHKPHPHPTPLSPARMLPAATTATIVLLTLVGGKQWCLRRPKH